MHCVVLGRAFYWVVAVTVSLPISGEFFTIDLLGQRIARVLEFF